MRRAPRGSERGVDRVKPRRTERGSADHAGARDQRMARRPSGQEDDRRSKRKSDDKGGVVAPGEARHQRSRADVVRSPGGGATGARQALAQAQPHHRSRRE